MRTHPLKIVVIFAVLLAVGCAGAKETAKVLWGSSTLALEKARPRARKQTFKCTADHCFAAVVKIVDEVTAQNEKVVKEALAATQTSSASKPAMPDMKEVVVTTNTVEGEAITADRVSLQIFLRDPKKNVIVLMGIPGCTDTTEVGVFFSPSDAESTSVEISSLSKIAKENAAEFLFPRIAKLYPMVLVEPAKIPTEKTAP